MLTEAEILHALRDCYDPERKLNLVDLGLIYNVKTERDPDSRPAWPRQLVKITMTLPAEESPANGLILEQVRNRLAGMQQISHVEVDLVWEPKWTPHRISAAGREQLELNKAAAQKPPSLVQISSLSSPAGRSGNSTSEEG
jgi:metal-sulfur cluster biosynthetic enzyme